MLPGKLIIESLLSLSKSRRNGNDKDIQKAMTLMGRSYLKLLEI